MARSLRIEYSGAFYHVTSRGNERKTIFSDAWDLEKFLSFLESAVERHGALVHAYSLMGNHYHLLLETPNANLSRIMRDINSSYSTYFNIKWKRSGHLFQGRYKAILVESDAYAAELSRYIHLNPVRAKMCEAPEEYPWMSYKFYTEGNEPSWLTTGFILGYFGLSTAQARLNYRHYIHDMLGRDYANPLDQTVASTILGRNDFVREIREKLLSDKKKDRDLPSLNELAEKPQLEKILHICRESFAENLRQGRRAGIYLCHRFSGAKLKEIGTIFRLSESGVTQASRRFEDEMAEDHSLREKILEVRKSLHL